MPRLARTKNRARAAVIEDEDDDDEYEGGDFSLEDFDGMCPLPTNSATRGTLD